MDDGTPGIEVGEYKSVRLNCLDEDRDIPYLKGEHFKYQSLAPFRVRELRNDEVEISNSSYSGIIQLDSCRINFSTKVKTNLFYMLSFLKDEQHFLYDPNRAIDIEEGASFFDVLGRLFINELEAILEQGLYRSYRREEDKLKFLRGKLDIRQQIQNEFRKDATFCCSFGDLTYDNQENRIVLLAATLLIPLIRFNDQVRDDLIRYRHIIQKEVSVATLTPDDCDRISFSRLNEHYKAIISFAKVILQSHFIRSTQRGAAKGFNFLVDMNKVYEDFVTSVIEDVIDNTVEFDDFVVEKQKRFSSLVREGRIITKPDVILRRKNTDEYPLIIDAKYKRDKSNNDYYQVIAYALAIPTAMACCLIYPDSEKDPIRSLTLDTKPFGYDRSDIKLHAKKLRLFLEPSDSDQSFHGYVENIRQQLQGILASCL